MVPSFNTTKNFKRGQYILNRYRWTDCIAILSTIVFSVAAILVWLNVFASKTAVINIIMIIVLLLPIGIIYLLFMPMPTYFNVLDFLVNAMKWLMKKKVYKWEGIHQFDEEDVITLDVQQEEGVIEDEHSKKGKKKSRVKKSKKRGN